MAWGPRGCTMPPGGLACLCAPAAKPFLLRISPADELEGPRPHNSPQNWYKQALSVRACRAAKGRICCDPGAPPGPV